MRDHRHADAAPTLFGDSLMFRQLSLGLFDALHERLGCDARIVDAISGQLARYLRADTGLLQPATGRVLHAPGVLDAWQLAVLAQNKAYEHTASECEELVFVRGSAGPCPDALAALPTVDRIRRIAALPLQYHERRNFLRHRAQKRAYLMHARLLREHAGDAMEAALLDRTIDHLTFADHLAGRRANLFELVAAHPGRTDTDPRSALPC